MPDVKEYQDTNNQSPFGRWFWGLEARAAARVTKAIRKLELGLRPNVEPVGKGVFEAKIDYGPGYRVYFGLDGTTVVILLGGGDKKTQDSDIAEAQRRWADYKNRKEQGFSYGAHPQLS